MATAGHQTLEEVERYTNIAQTGGRYLTCQNLSTGTLSGAVGSGIQARSVIYAAWRQEYSAESRASVEGRSFPVMEPTTRVGNRLLAALPPADFDLLAPHLRKVPLERDAVLVRSGDPIEQIYFPCSGTIAFMLDRSRSSRSQNYRPPENVLFTDDQCGYSAFRRTIWVSI